MSPYHLLMDACLWFCSLLWFIGFLARGPKPRKHNRRLPAPSPLCERTGQFEVRMHDTVFSARQAD
jgi:hypothetical protein